MNDPDQPPGVNALSDAEKDQLIVELRRELEKERALRRRFEQKLLELDGGAAAGARLHPLLARLRDAEPNKRARTHSTSRAKSRLGGAFGFLRSGIVIGAIAVVKFLVRP